MLKTFLLVVCAAFALTASVSADIPWPPCNPDCVVSVSSH